MRFFHYMYFPCLLVASTLVGQSAYKPKLVNSKDGSHHDFPLGVLEATGRLKDGEKEILVMDVGKGGAAQKAGLMAGDRVMMIEGKTPDVFSKKTDTGLEGPQALLGNSLDRKSSSSNPVLSLRVRRESGQRDLSVDLPKSPSFSFSRPLACPKRMNYLAEIARHLVEVQEKNGRWKPGVGGDAGVYTTAFCGLVFSPTMTLPTFPPSSGRSNS